MLTSPERQEPVWNEEAAIAILAVDDEPGVLALVRRCLDDGRVALSEASNGKDVLGLYLTSHADRLFGAKPQLWAEEAHLDEPFTREGLREAVALLLFGRTSL